MHKVFISVFLMVLLPLTCLAQTQLSQTQLDEIGRKIYLNETGGKPEYLVAWNDGEGFASLGIGHFIWFPENTQYRFVETFPELLVFIKSKGVELPTWLNNSMDCPWPDKSSFIRAQNSEKMRDLYALMQSTMSQQVEFIYLRMQRSLELMINDTPNQHEQTLLTQTFEFLSKTPLGMYSLIDYVNFKGEGVSLSERYNQQGWGLKQVLLAMEGKLTHKAFSQSCIKVLTARVSNSPQQEIEKRWLRGWIKRCNTYSQM